MAASVSFAMQHTSSGSLMSENASVEQEQDANLALTDLDKGLRSIKHGVQCESVVRFPRLFEKYPFPILINSAFLRLADVFRAGNNFLRWCILRVTIQSQKHLDKILNIDEFMRRIFSVIHSNDPVARAITLRTLGSIACIVPERKNVHHCIVNGLDSHDALEVDAAVYAAKKFAAISRTFAANICSKIASMIEEIATPVDLKLKLIPVLQHMHHDVQTSAKASGVCQELLQSFPAQKFVTLTLHTMTQLASESLVDIQSHVQLLIRNLKEDPRKAVKFVVLKNMNHLAQKAPHLWTYQSVEALYDFVLSNQCLSLKTAGLEVLSTLSSSVVFHFFMEKNVSEEKMKTILDICNLCYLSEDPILSAKALQFFTNITICYKNSSCTFYSEEELVEGARLALTTQICLSTASSEPKDHTALKNCLICAVKFAKSFPETSILFATDIVQLLQSASDCNALMLSEALAAMGHERSVMLQQIIPDLLFILQDVTQTSQISNQLKTSIGTLLFQAASGEPIPDNVSKMINSCMTEQSSNPWFAYKLCRQAMRYGQYSIAADLFTHLSQKVASEHFYFWLLGLKEICIAESHLQDVSSSQSYVLRVTDTLIHYQKGLASLKAAATPASPLQFQCGYLALRVELLQVHSQLVKNCNTFRTCPPPAISTALAISHGQEISRCGQILSQLKKSMAEYEALSKKFSLLYQSAFDADPDTLHNIILLQESCEVMKSTIYSIMKPGQTGVQNVFTADNEPLSVAIHQVQNKVMCLLQTETGEALTHKQMDLLGDAVNIFLGATFRYPRFFFQTLQSTVLKLAVSPQQNAQMEPILVHNDTFLTLKVEGVIQHKERRELFRKVEKVNIHVTSNLLNKSQTVGDVKFADTKMHNSLKDSVAPHNDYFSISFVLSFPVSGIHNLSVEAAVIDETGTQWKTGPKLSMTVKSYDDMMMKKQSKPVRTSFGQMPGHS